MSVDALPPSPRTAWAPDRAALAACVVVAAALSAAYAANVYDLATRSWSDPNYSHGYLVVPIALVILWQRRGELDPARLRPNLLGWPALLAVVAARLYLFERNEQWVESATIPVAAAALALAFGGWHLLRWALPAIAFLWFMLPLPPRLNLILAGPLQSLATLGSTWLLHVIGLPVLSEGNTILVGAERLEVARACNGLSMLLSFVTLITATTILIRTRPLWERIVLLLSTVPIALISNILRIVVTAICYHRLGREWGEKIVHDTAGFAMMPIALALVMLELRILSWLVVEEEVESRPRLVMPPAYAPPRPARKKPAPGPDEELSGPAPG